MQKTTLIILLVVVIALIISIAQCNKNANYFNQSQQYLASLNDTITYLKNGIAQKPATEINKDLFIRIIKERDDLSKALNDANLKAKNIKTITQVITSIQTDTITIALHDTIPCPDFTPVTFALDSQYYDIAGTVSKKSIVISKIDFPDSTYIITAKKNHIFRKNEFLVSVQHSNPYIKTIGLHNFTIQEEKKWWQSGWIKFGAGVLAGTIAVSSRLLK